MAGKRKILFLASNPKDSGHLRLEDEAKLIDVALRNNGNGDAFEFYNVGAATISDLRQAMLNYKPDIVHFSGHGSEEDTILFEDAEGYTKEINSDDLGEFFKHFSETVECVVLNACYSLKQADGLKQNIRILIGMSSEIPNDSAKIFTTAFYDALCADYEIEEAFNIAKSSLKLEQKEDGHIPLIHINESLKVEGAEEKIVNADLESRLISEDYFKETRNSTRNKIIFWIAATVFILLVAAFFVIYFRNEDQESAHTAYAGGSATLLSLIPIYEIMNKKGDFTQCKWLWKRRQEFLLRAANVDVQEIEEFNEMLRQSLMKIIKGGK